MEQNVNPVQHISEHSAILGFQYRAINDAFKNIF